MSRPVFFNQESARAWQEYKIAFEIASEARKKLFRALKRDKKAAAFGSDPYELMLELETRLLTDEKLLDNLHTEGLFY